MCCLLWGKQIWSSLLYQHYKWSGR